MAWYCRMSGVEAASTDGGEAPWDKPTSPSGIDAAGLQSRSDSINGQHIGRQPVTNVVLFRVGQDVTKTVHHDLFQAAVDQLLIPEEALPVLHPFKVRHRDAAGVREDIG